MQPQIEQDAQHVRSRGANMACSWKRCGIISVLAVIVTMAITVGVILAVTMSTSTEHDGIDATTTPTTEHDNILHGTMPPTIDHDHIDVTIPPTTDHGDNNDVTIPSTTDHDNNDDDTIPPTTDHDDNNDITIPSTTDHDHIDVTTAPTTSASTASFVVIGGYQEVDGKEDSLNTVDSYNVSAGSITWSHSGEPSPSYWTLAGRAVSGTDIYVVGGSTHKKGDLFMSAQYGTYRYSVVDNTWQQLPNTSWYTNGPAVFIHNDKRYAAYERDIWSIVLGQVNSEANSWSKENITLPHDVHGHNAVVSVRDRVFFFGKDYEYSRSVISWRPGTDESWTSVSDMNVARFPPYLCSVTDGVDMIWVMAGCTYCFKPGFIEMYQVSTDTWTKLDAVPEYTGAGSGESISRICGYHDGYIYAIFNDDPRFHIFNTLDNTWSISDTQLKTNAEFQSAVIVKHG